MSLSENAQYLVSPYPLLVTESGAGAGVPPPPRVRVRRRSRNGPPGRDIPSGPRPALAAAPPVRG